MPRLARSIAAPVLSLAVAIAATGWLYLARPLVALPGPHVGDALPLDELSQRGSVPLLLFLAVWGSAAALLGGVARWARVERLTAGILLALGIGAWDYAVNGVSLLVVRQIPAHQAFHVAAAERAVVIPAALAGLGGALLGCTSNSARPRLPLALAWLVAAAGVLALVDATLPEHRRSLVTALDVTHVHGLSKALVAPLAVALLVTARGLARRQRRAWQVALVVLTALLVLHVERRFDEGALISGVATMALLARRADFRLRGDPTTKPRIAVHAAVAVVGIAAYGLGTLWVNRLMADQPYTLGFGLRETGHALLGVRESSHLAAPVSDWFPVSVILLAVGAAGLLLVEWLSPWRHRVHQEARARELAKALVARHGVDTLAPFTLRADKSYFFSEAEDAFLSYRVLGGVAIVAGDPIGPPARLRGLVERFLEFSHERGWRVAVLGVSESALALYRSVGLLALYHGDEAIVDVDSFSLEGRAIRKVRQSVSRLTGRGFRVLTLRAGEVDTLLRVELEAIARDWRGEAPERGFVMALDALFRLGDDDAVFVVGLDERGRPCGFLHFAVVHAASALSLSSMPRLGSVPNGFNEWLICEAVAWAREHGLRNVSLNFAPFAALLAPDGDLTAAQRMQALALRSLKGHFQLDNLLVFNGKFRPRWERRFVVYERRLDLPRVGIAALAAEAYLPFQ